MGIVRLCRKENVFQHESQTNYNMCGFQELPPQRTRIGTQECGMCATFDTSASSFSSKCSIFMNY